MIAGTPDPQMVNPEWERLNQPQIDGVVVHEVKHVLAAGGFLTEIFRSDWNLPGKGIDQIFVRVLEGGAISAWHCHAVTTDRLFCLSGRMLLVLYDGRRDSPSAKTILQLRIGHERPALVVVPCGVWHGIKNLMQAPAILLNAVDEAYTYEEPDHWRVAPESGEIPFDFGAAD